MLLNNHSPVSLPVMWRQRILKVKSREKVRAETTSDTFRVFFWLDRAYMKEGLKLELEFVCKSLWQGNEWMSGERRERKTSVTGRGQKAEEYEFRDGKGQQKGKTECFWLCTPILVKQVRRFCREELSPRTYVRFYNKEVDGCWCLMLHNGPCPREKHVCFFHSSMCRLGILCVANIHIMQKYQGNSGV